MSQPASTSSSRSSSLSRNAAPACGSLEHLSRRTLLKGAGLAGLSWLTPLGQLLALDAEKQGEARARSVIILWLGGGPSQLETFDPHPDSPIAFGTRAIQTSLRGARLAAGLEHTANILSDLSLIRSVVSKEGDHERAVYDMQTGYRPSPALAHPAIGAIVAHELPNPTLEIPTHISILPGQWPSRGGYFGAGFDPFQAGDPAQPVADLSPRIDARRQDARLKDLSVLEAAFQIGRPAELDISRTLQGGTLSQALRMMSSDQVKAFAVTSESASRRHAYGDTPFGRGCLAAARLVEAGVRCVEVTLGGWDTHANNHAFHTAQLKVLDPALSALITDLKQRELLDRTVVLCGGEFGRTPKLNPFGGRDHWPHGFSVAIAGGGIRPGQIIGGTDPRGERKEPQHPVRVEDIHATILSALGIRFGKEIVTPVGRPVALSEGRVIRELLA